MSEDDKIPLTEHLEELRTRLIRCFVAIGIGFGVCYYFKEKIFDLLMIPLLEVMPSEDKIVFTSLPEAFFTYIKVAFLSGIILASPVILYQFWRFVAPGLYATEKRVLFPIVLLSSFFFVGGALFGYFVVFPFGFGFFLSFSNGNIQALPKMNEYFGFASKLLIAFGLVFELPLVITFLARLGLVSVSFLRKNRKYAILIIFIVAAIITPPDPLSQVLMAIPLMILYEISILGARLFGRESTGSDAEEETPPS